MENKIKVYELLQRVANKNGVPYEEVVREINFAIASAIKNCEQGGNTYGAEFWASVPRTGEHPTAEELLTYMLAHSKI